MWSSKKVPFDPGLHWTRPQFSQDGPAKPPFGQAVVVVQSHHSSLPKGAGGTIPAPTVRETRRLVARVLPVGQQCREFLPFEHNTHGPTNEMFLLPQSHKMSSVKTAKSSLARGHVGGFNWGYPELEETRDPRHGFGGPYTRKKFLKT